MIKKNAVGNEKKVGYKTSLCVIFLFAEKITFILCIRKKGLKEALKWLRVVIYVFFFAYR